MYGIPKVFARQVYAAREECVAALMQYLGPDGEELREGALPLIIDREPSMIDCGVSLENRARAQLTILHAYVPSRTQI
jgi:hypothetical protein